MWISPQEPEAADILVWFNGQHITPACVGFDKLYSAGQAYWGNVQILVKVLPGKAMENGMLSAAARAIIVQRTGLIQWEYISDAQEL